MGIEEFGVVSSSKLWTNVAEEMRYHVTSPTSGSRYLKWKERRVPAACPDPELPPMKMDFKRGLRGISGFS